MSTNNIGTFGQYSVGVSGQIKDTGWLGFVRVDYRDGSEIHGLSDTGGIGYQFSPTAVDSAMLVKARVKAPAKDELINWTGWYVALLAARRRRHVGPSSSRAF